MISRSQNGNKIHMTYVYKKKNCVCLGWLSGHKGLVTVTQNQSMPENRTKREDLHDINPTMKTEKSLFSMIEKTTHLVSAVVYGHGLTDFFVTNLINLKLRRSSR